MKKSVLMICCFFMALVCFAKDSKDYFEELKTVKIREVDDSVYNGPDFDELCLIDNTGREFKLYHNVRKIAGFNCEDYEIKNKWNNSIKQELNNLTIGWNYENGCLLHISTESKAVQTKRGIRIGDSVEKVKEAYKDMNLKSDDSAIGLVQANMIDEELMFLLYYIEDNKVSRIVIAIENWTKI